MLQHIGVSPRSDTLRGCTKLYLWRVNLVSFGLFCVLTLTGLTNWLLLPRGYGAAGAGLLISLRHLLRGVHEWTAVLFIITVLIHLGLHGAYLRSKLKKHGKRE